MGVIPSDINTPVESINSRTESSNGSIPSDVCSNRYPSHRILSSTEVQPDKDIDSKRVDEWYIDVVMGRAFVEQSENEWLFLLYVLSFP